MVLHNNKWDKKAKYRYMKKHGLLGQKKYENVDLSEENQPKLPPNLPPHLLDQFSDLENERSNENDTNTNLESSVAGETSQIADYLPQNYLEFTSKKDEDDDDEFLQLSELTKNVKSFAEEPSKPVKPKIDLENADFETLLRNQESSSDEEDTRVLSAEEMKEFAKLQEKIKKEKIYREIKSTFKASFGKTEDEEAEEKKAENNVSVLLNGTGVGKNDDEFMNNININDMEVGNLEERNRDETKKHKKKTVKINDNDLDDLLGL